MKPTIHRFKSIPSTNDEAARMADEGASEGTVVVAAEQIGARGRRGRTWASPPEDGLYLSIILRPKIERTRLWETGFLAAVATAEAIREVSDLQAHIKWPNDILIEQRKVAGILVEARAVTRAAIIGVGINVNNRSFPSEIAEKATSIALAVGRRIPIEKVEESLLSQVGGWYEVYICDGFAPILDAWRKLDCTVGREIEVETPGGVIRGTAIGVDRSGNMRVEQAYGRIVRVFTGEVLLPNY